MSAFLALLSRDIRLATRAGGGAALALAFFAAVAALVPLGVGADLTSAGPHRGRGVVGGRGAGGAAVARPAVPGRFRGWRARPDRAGAVGAGGLERWPRSRPIGWPPACRLTLLSPLLALLFNLPDQGYVALLVSLAIGTPAASAIGAIGAGLTMSRAARRADPAAAGAAAAGAGRDLRRRGRDRGAGRAGQRGAVAACRPFHLPRCCWPPLLRRPRCGSIWRAEGDCCMRARVAARRHREGAVESTRMNIFELANPKRFMGFSGALLPWLWGGALLCLGAGLYLGLFAVPPDYQQGDTVKIMFIHVPAAQVAHDGLCRDGRGQHLRAGQSPSAGRCRGQGRRPAGGAVHGAGADHRFALGQADVGRLLGVGCAADLVPDPALPLFRLYGAVERVSRTRRGRPAPPPSWRWWARSICRSSNFSVDWWNTLHQGESIIVKAGRIAPVFLCPLLLMMAGYALLFFALWMTRIRTEILARRARSLQLRWRSAS